VAPTPTAINVRKRKFDNSIKSEWEGELFPVQFPDWLLVLHHPDRHRKFYQAETSRFELLFLHGFSLVHPLAFLFVYSSAGEFREAKCDAALPATRKENLIEFTDLDLDLIVNPDFSYYFRDEDQFAVNQQKMGYSETVVAQARNGMSLAESWVESRHFPFDNTFIPNLKWAENTQGY
jgi:predicted RNA-binding protein associated with RNAse of E/G family